MAWKVYFHHDLPGSHNFFPILTTATPPRSHNQNLLLCWKSQLGMEEYIRAEWVPLHSWRIRLWRMNTHPVASEEKVCLTHHATLPSSVKFLHLFSCCAVLFIFYFLPLKLGTKIGGFEPQPFGASIWTGVPDQQEELCFTCLDDWLFVSSDRSSYSDVGLL